MIELKHVSKIYDGNVVGVEDVTLKIEKGEFVFLVGESGSGKSTMLKLLMKEVNPTSGRRRLYMRMWRLPWRPSRNLSGRFAGMYREFSTWWGSLIRVGIFLMRFLVGSNSVRQSPER